MTLFAVMQDGQSSPSCRSIIMSVRIMVIRDDCESESLPEARNSIWPPVPKSPLMWDVFRGLDLTSTTSLLASGTGI